MHFTSTLLCVTSMLGGTAFGAPLSNQTIATAGGGLPDIELPTLISASAATELQLAHFLENLETAFFHSWTNTSLKNTNSTGTNFTNTSLTSANLTNTSLTNSSPNIGSTNASQGSLGSYAEEVVQKIAAQEEVHLASTAYLLEAYDLVPITPCQYSFPANSTEQFVELAHLITSVGIGATIGLTERLAATDPLLVGLLSSTLAVESRHDAFFHHVDGKLPNPAPFDTGISDVWAYNLALSFAVPGSCAVDIPVPILPPLNISQVNTTGGPGQNSTQWEFTWDPKQVTFVNEAGKQLFVGWIDQLNLPAYAPLNMTSSGRGTAEAPSGLNGVTFAVITAQEFETISDLSRATMAGPAIVPSS